MNALQRAAGRLYSVLPVRPRDGDDAKLGGELRDALPTNVSAVALNGLFFPAAGKIASVGLLLTWFINDLTPAAWVVGLIVPIQFGLSMLAQPLFAHWLSTRKRRVPAYAYQTAVRVVCWTLLAVATWTIGKEHPTLLLATFFTLIATDALAAGMGNIVFSDVLACVIPPGMRGRARAWRGIFGAVTSGIAGVMLIKFVGDESSFPVYGWLFVAAAALYALGGAAFALVHEGDCAQSDGRPSIGKLIGQVREVMSNATFRRFAIVQALLVPMIQGLALFTLLGKKEFDLKISALGGLIMIDALAPLLSNVVFGHLADRHSNRRVILIAAAAGLLAPAAALLLMWKGHDWSFWPTVSVFGLIVFAIGFALTGLDLATKNFVLGLSEDEKKRPMFIGVSDLLAGVPTIVIALAGFVIDRAGDTGFAAVFIGMAVMTIAAIGMAFGLNEDAKKSE